MNRTYEHFSQPDAASRGRPFWAWNGALQEEELLRQIEVLHEMGFGGFFMHARTGLDTQYLSEDWFQMIRACAQKARALGMQPWMYSEDRWPSGYGGGLVTQEPAFRQNYLQLLLQRHAPTDDTALAVFRGRVQGLRLEPEWSQVRAADVQRVQLESDETFLVFRRRAMAPSSAYNGFTDVDRLNPAATRRFLDITHEAYAAQCGQSFEDIPGDFLDEPYRGTVFSDFCERGEAMRWSIPWTDALPQVFRERFGEDLICQLPALFLQPEGHAVVPVKWQYMELLQSMFLSNFVSPIRDWLHTHGKKLTGHFLHEDSLTAQAVPCGSMMRCYAAMDEPGIDVLTEHSFVPWAVKALESVARQTGKTQKLSELFGATGWQMSFADFKYHADWQTILGINVRCPHLSWYTMQAEAKRDFPGSFLHQATWYREFASLETYLSRLALAASSGTPVCDTLVLHPIESLWCQIHPEWEQALTTRDPAIQKIERHFTTLFHWLMESQTDFDYADEGLLAELAQVEISCPFLRVGRMRYRRVVVSGCLNIRQSTYTLLEAFEKAGGEVVLIGKAPEYLACRHFSENQDLFTRVRHIPMQKQAALTYFSQIPKPVQVLDKAAAADLYQQLRQTQDGLMVLLWNKSRKTAHTGVLLQLPAGCAVQKWDCFTGERTALPTTDSRVELDFLPGQEAILLLQADTHAEPLPMLVPAAREARLELAPPLGYTLDEPNILVLDAAKLSVDGASVGGLDEILNLDRLLRQRLGLPLRGGEMVQPWAQKSARQPQANIRLEFPVAVECPPEAPIYFAMEPMEGQRLFLDGVPLALEETELRWIDACFHVYALPQGCLTLGVHTLALEGVYTPSSGLESMYLLGSFGVWRRKGQMCIGHLPENLRFGNLVHQGLPFYSGKVHYRFALPKQRSFRLELPQIGGSCAAVRYAGERKLLPWKGVFAAFPYVDGEDELELEVILNRRNTFGPLHRFPLRQPAASPDHFTCEDVTRYGLYPTGILTAPELYLREP